jgi:hypothetical protein
MAEEKTDTAVQQSGSQKSAQGSAGPGAAPLPQDRPPSEKEIVQPSVPKALEAFLLEVDALANTLSLVTPLVQSSAVTSSKALTDFLNSRCKTSNGGKTFTVPTDEYLDFINIRRQSQRSRRALQIIPRSFLASLISHYDAFTGSLLRALFFMKPEVLNSSERMFSFKDLVSFESISAAREWVVDKEVETLLRESHADQFKWMEKKFATPLTKDLPSWPTFVEITERRNLFTHCNGIVSAQYLAVCSQNGVDCSKVKVGMELHVTPQYFQDAYATIVEIGLKLAHVLWRRLKPEEMEAADTSLNNLCLDLIRDEKYAIARNLLDFAAQFNKFGSESIRMILLLNRAQAYKWSGHEKRAKEILAAEDWTAANEKFQLAAAVLNDDFKTAAKLMKHIGAESSPTKGDYKEWPMFKVFRTSPEFTAAYKELFGKPFGEVTAEEISEKKEVKSIQ